MRRANPAFIPRNHNVEAALAAAVEGDLAPFERLHAVLSRPYDDQPESADLATPPSQPDPDTGLSAGHNARRWSGASFEARSARTSG